MVKDDTLYKAKKEDYKEYMVSENIYKAKREDYGADYQRHLFEQYKLFIEGMEKTSDRREGANKYFVSINAAILTALVISFKIGAVENIELIYVFPIFGLVICIIFYFLLRSYKQLNTGKFKVIHEIEENLPLALYKTEWEVLGEGKDKSKYLPFSHLEKYVPFVFGVLYIIILLLLIISYCSQ